MEITKDQRDRYIQRRKSEIFICRDYLNEKKFENIAVIGHKLHGNGTTFGLPELSQLGSELEKSAQKRDIKSIIKYLNRISHFINSIH